MKRIKEEFVEPEIHFRTFESEKENEDHCYYDQMSIRDQIHSAWGIEPVDIKPKIERIDMDESYQPIIHLDRDYLRKNFRANWIKTVESTFRRPSIRKACQLCTANMIFDTATELIDHYAKFHRPEIASTQCTLCDFSGKTEEDIFVHWKGNHSSCRRKNIDKYTVLKERNNPENIWVGDDELVRSIYPRKKNVYANEEQRMEAAKVECEICFKKLGRYSIKSHMLLLHCNEKPYTCDYCKKSFALKQYLIKHMITHTNEKKYECNVCFKKFGHKSSFQMHNIIHFKDSLPENDPRVKRRKRELELVECAICKLKVGRKSLFLHKKIHIEELPHKCDTCGKSFRRKSSMKEHMHTHMDKKPFACKQCPKTFGSRRGLDHHELVHLKGILPDNDPRWKWCEYKKKTVECDICFKTLNVYSLKDHKRIHANEKPFKCNVCDKSFRIKTHMKLHMKIHTQKKPKYKCSFCHCKFRTESYLKVHERHHREGRPTCQFCKMEFPSNAAALRHIRTVHFFLLRKREKLTGELNELFQGYRTFECYKCNFSHNFMEVKKHMEKCQADDNCVQCPKCVRKFRSKPSYHNHLKVHVTNKENKPNPMMVSQIRRKFECHICRYFTDGLCYRTLKQHLKEMHPQIS